MLFFKTFVLLLLCFSLCIAVCVSTGVLIQSLIVGSGLESSELEAWRDVLLECGHVPKM